MFNEYPYTDFHEMNTDWIISKIKNVETAEANTKQYAEDADAAKVAAEDAKDVAVAAKDDAVEAKDDAVEAKDDAISFLTDTKDQLDLLQARVDNIIPDGTQTAGNLELLDIRVGGDGITYDSAGNAVRGQFAGLKGSIEITDDVKCIFFERGYYIRTNYTDGTVIDYTSRTAAAPEMGCAVIDCAEGDIFTITGTGGSNGRLYAFINSDNELISKSSSSMTVTDFSIAAPAGSAKCIINVNGNAIKGKSTNVKLSNYEKIDSRFYGSGYTIDCNDVVTNQYKIFNLGATLTNGPSDFTDWQDGEAWCIESFGVLDIGSSGHISYQVIRSLSDDIHKRKAIRQKYNNTWFNWTVIDAYTESNIITVDINGTGDYTKFTDALSYA